MTEDPHGRNASPRWGRARTQNDRDDRRSELPPVHTGRRLAAELPMSQRTASLPVRSSVLALVTAVAVAGAADPVRAGAASFSADAPLRSAGGTTLSCLLSSADGSLVSWQDRQRTIHLAALVEAG